MQYKIRKFNEILPEAKRYSKKTNREVYIVIGISDPWEYFYPFAILDETEIDYYFIDPWMIEAIVYPNGESELWK